jgi:putative transposase
MLSVLFPAFRGIIIPGIERRKIFRTNKTDLYSMSRLKPRSEARSVFCHWAARELGVEGARMAEGLGMSPPGVAYAVKGGERVVREKVLQMIE